MRNGAAGALIQVFYFLGGDTHDIFFPAVRRTVWLVDTKSGIPCLVSSFRGR